MKDNVREGLVAFGASLVVLWFIISVMYALSCALERGAEMAKAKGRKPPSPEARERGRQTQARSAREAALADELADTKRERDELAERLDATTARDCPSCGAETRDGKLRPAKPGTTTGSASVAVDDPGAESVEGVEVEGEPERAPVTNGEDADEGDGEGVFDGL